MMHLFFVNNHMTYLTAKQTVKHLKLTSDKCLYLLERNYPIEKTSIQSLTFPYQNFPNDSFKASLAPWTLWKRMKELDTFLSEITNGEAFEIFYPQTAVTHFYIIASHPKCTGYSLIEGGIGCYKPEYKTRVSHGPSKLRKLFYSFIYKGRVPNQKFFFNTSLSNFKYSVGTNEYAFASYKNQLNVGSPFEEKEEYKDMKHVLVIDCVVEYYDAKMETIEEMMRLFFEKMKTENVKQIHFKLHPEHYRREGLRDKYVKLIRRMGGDIETIELDNTVILEHIARSSEAVFYVNISSVGLYANILGKEVWSFARVLFKLEPHMDITYKEIGPNKIHYF